MKPAVFWVVSLVGILGACTGTIDDAGERAAEPADQPRGRPGRATEGGGGRPGGTMLPGQGGTPGGSPVGAMACQPDPGPTLLRRLTNTEYRNTVRDLLGVTDDPAQAFPADSHVLGFDNNAEAINISPLHTAQYQLAAERLAAVVTSDPGRRAQVLGCDPAAAGAGCVRSFIDRFGGKAFRRPLTTAERDGLLALATSAAGDADRHAGVRLVLEALLQSPSFLFRAEVGVPDPARPGLLRLSGHEIATRLSYLLFQTTPDDTLLAAAGAGALDTPAGIEARARQMLADPRARQGLRAFYRQWFQTHHLDDVVRDPARYPGWDDALVGSMREETDRLLEPMVTTNTDFLDMLTTTDVWVDAPLAKLYGTAVPPTGRWQKAKLDGVKRGGFLTLAAALVPTANGSALAMPIHRGLWVREVLFCEQTPPPPANIPDLPEGADPSRSDRERLEAHSKSPACVGCHALVDPIGFGLSHYDAVGAYRDKDSGGKPIDARGTIAGVADGNFEGGVDLGRKLRAAPQVSACVVTSLFRYGQGRDAGDADRCTTAALAQAFRDGGHRFPDLLLAFVKSDAFRYRHPAAAQKGATP